MINNQASPIQAPSNSFVFCSQDVRTAIGDDGEVWFCAKDVCEAIDIKWGGDKATLKNMPDEWFMVLNLQTIKGNRDATFLNEAGVFRLIFRSSKPKAVEFANWVCSEVLPAIRKQGFYGQISAQDQIKLTTLFLRVVDRVQSSKNAFVFDLMVRRLRSLCIMLGEPMPPLAMLDQDRKQLSLEV